MSRRHSIMFTIAAFVILCCGCRATARADPLVVTLGNAIQSGSPGQTVTFSASAYNPNSSASDADQIIGLGINPRGPEEIPAIMGFRHAPVGTSSRNTIHSSSRLLLPVTSSAAP